MNQKLYQQWLQAEYKDGLYKQGKENTNADALSRLPLPSQSPGTRLPAEFVHLMEHLLKVYRK